MINHNESQVHEDIPLVPVRNQAPSSPELEKKRAKSLLPPLPVRNETRFSAELEKKRGNSLFFFNREPPRFRANG